MKNWAKWGVLSALAACAVGGPALADTYIVTHTGTVISQDSGRDVFFSTWRTDDLTGLPFTVVFTYTFDPSNLTGFAAPLGALNAYPGDGSAIATAVLTIDGRSFSTAQSTYLADYSGFSRALITPPYNTDYTTQTEEYLSGGAGALDFTVSSDTNFVGSVDFRAPFSYTLTDADRANPHTSTYLSYDGASFVFSDETISTRYISGVPEPTSWSLMILGFAGAGALLRTRRRAAFAA
jgi:PEP-CTERM motif